MLNKFCCIGRLLRNVNKFSIVFAIYRCNCSCLKQRCVVQSATVCQVLRSFAKSNNLILLCALFAKHFVAMYKNITNITCFAVKQFAIEFHCVWTIVCKTSFVAWSTCKRHAKLFIVYVCAFRRCCLHLNNLCVIQSAL
jgi:hypothetical protein